MEVVVEGSAPSPARVKPVDLVLEGGGVKGIGLAGALSVLEEQGYRPVNIAGSSAGAIVATLLAAGYTAAELREMIQAVDFEQFRDPRGTGRVPVVGPGLSFLLYQGIYEGRALQRWMAAVLEAKGIRRFGDLVLTEYADDPRYRWKVLVIASDLTQRRLLVLPRDAHTLGVEPDELSVALAVRMSMSLPIFFEPVRLWNRGTGKVHVIVDGGILSNFPVWLFDVEGEPEWPTFGLLLVEGNPRTSLAERMPPRERGEAGGIVDYVWSVALTMLEAHDRLYLENANFARTVTIPTLGVRSVDFALPTERAWALYHSGREAAERFLASWDFEAYVEEYRRQKAETHRRRDLTRRSHAAAER